MFYLNTYLVGTDPPFSLKVDFVELVKTYIKVVSSGILILPDYSPYN